jgi:hypothetical protein
MTTEQFDERLKGLADLVGNHDLADTFNDQYEQLHKEIEAHNGPRFEWAARLRRLGDQQLMYLSNQWIRADQEEWAPAWLV